MLSDGAFAVWGYYSTRKIILQGCYSATCTPSINTARTSVMTSKGQPCGDDEVRILAHFQRADAVGYADMFRRVDGDGLQRIELIHARP